MKAIVQMMARIKGKLLIFISNYYFQNIYDASHHRSKQTIEHQLKIRHVG
jgi:hypothetical protein